LYCQSLIEFDESLNNSSLLVILTVISIRKFPASVALLLLILILFATVYPFQTNITATAQGITSTTTTPIKHLVVIFQENVSFDHYFATYPIAANNNSGSGEPLFAPKPSTPSVNGLSADLLNNNPNLVNPFRIPRSSASTCDNYHSYTRLQEAYNGGLYYLCRPIWFLRIAILL
jgi:phospholipase C